MDWHFCPHCETQLDAVTFICPACRWDPLAPPDQEPDPAAGLSLTERYRGTQYSANGLAAAPAITHGAPIATTSRMRTFIVVGFVLLLGLYGSMLVVSDFQNRPTDRPASLLQR